MARVASTYDVFSATSDEPIHIASGIQYWEHGRYDYEFQHPPLARLAVALGPYFFDAAHVPSQPTGPDLHEIGYDYLYRGGQGEAFQHRLALARMGVLPFLALLCAVTYLWAARYFSPSAGVWAVLLLTSTPPVLGHAGIATTDLICAATTALALYVFLRFLEQLENPGNPDWVHSISWGAAAGLAIYSKFSSIGFLGVCYAIGFFILWLRSRKCSFRVLWKPTLLATATAVLLLWAGYGFTIQPLSAIYGPSPDVDQALSSRPMLRTAWDFLRSIPLPLTEVAIGFRDVLRHNSVGHNAYLLGEFRTMGWWYFFPVVLAVKTPIGLLGLALAGMVLVLYKWRGVDRTILLTVLFPAAILAIAMTARINLGVRHILPIYPLLAILAGSAMAAGIAAIKAAGGRKVVGIVALSLTGWVVVDAWRAAPDFLADFNEFAGDHPEHILVESDLDWGQDLNRLAQRLRELDADHVSIGYFGSQPLDRSGLPDPRVMGMVDPIPGYIAVSLTLFEQDYARYGGYAWLRPYQPIERIGKSIDLYYLDTLP